MSKNHSSRLLYTGLLAIVGLALLPAPGRTDDAAGAPPAAAGDDVFGLTRIHKFHLELSADEWAAMQAVAGRGPMGGGQGRGPQGPGSPAGPPRDAAPREGGPREDAPREVGPRDAAQREVGPREGGPSGPRVEEERRRDPAPPRDASAPRDAAAPRRTDVHRSAGFGTEFPWAHGKLEAFGQTFDDIGVRYKGNASYMGSAGRLKRNLKLDLDHYRADGQFRGMKALNLNAGAADPTRLREALAFDAFRAAGVPAPRTAFVELTLSVPGKYDHELVGMYTLIEQVDRAFLKDRFEDSNGLLMKPERMRDFSYLGDDWDRYASQYQPKHKPSKQQARRMIEFVRLLDSADKEAFAAGIADYLDVDEFLRFLATSAWLSNMDSMFAIGHNFYMYLDPRSGKVNFLPWDLDLSFAGFPMMGSPDDLMNLSLKHPHAGNNKLIDRVLGVPEFSRRYDALLAELVAGPFAKERLLGQIAALESATAEPRAREQAAVDARNEGRRSGPFGGAGFGRTPALTAFVEKRSELVAAQLAGTSPGYTPRGGFGPGGRGGPGRFGPGNFLARPLLEALDTNKDGKLDKEELVAGATKLFQSADAEGRGKLDQAQIAAALADLIPGPPGFGPAPVLPGGAGGNRPAADRPAAERPADGERPPVERPSGERPADQPFPGGEARRVEGGPPEGARFFSPATMIAAAILKRGDADHDDRLTLEEAVSAAEGLFAEADTDKKTELDEAKLAVAVNGMFPAPPGFGRPGFGPPGFGPPGGGPPGDGPPGAGRPDGGRPDAGRPGADGPPSARRGFGPPGARPPADEQEVPARQTEGP